LISSESLQKKPPFDICSPFLRQAGLAIMNLKYDLREVVGSLSLGQKLTLGLLCAAGLILLGACGGHGGVILKDASPKIMFVDGINVGDQICRGVDLYELDWQDPVTKQGLIAKIVHEATGVITEIKVGSAIDCGPGIIAQITGLVNNGKLHLTAMVSDLN